MELHSEGEPCDEKRVFSTFFHTRSWRVWSESSAQRRSGRRRLAAGLGHGGRMHLLRGARRFLLCRLFTTGRDACTETSYGETFTGSDFGYEVYVQPTQD
ncbi:hypothetical protein PR001_g8383 [Phytophthora rubi]|uniref:Uncharacterized protein n=1 Tax=Phytophthora rubi TaxID=129364 RepID=A0A6A3N6X9_9STRA|nr:hypothetical protein PR001_g8383 [Phytophthora rubi]